MLSPVSLQPNDPSTTTPTSADPALSGGFPMRGRRGSRGRRTGEGGGAEAKEGGEGIGSDKRRG
jgi:hypothetical protein